MKLLQSRFFLVQLLTQFSEHPRHVKLAHVTGQPSFTHITASHGQLRPPSSPRQPRPPWTHAPHTTHTTHTARLEPRRGSASPTACASSSGKRAAAVNVAWRRRWSAWARRGRVWQRGRPTGMFGMLDELKLQAWVCPPVTGHMIHTLFISLQQVHVSSVVKCRKHVAVGNSCGTQCKQRWTYQVKSRDLAAAWACHEVWVLCTSIPSCSCKQQSSVNGPLLAPCRP